MILLLNPRSASVNRRIPLSLLTVGAGLEGRFDYEILDENFHYPIDSYLERRIREKEVRYLCMTVMPGPQLVRAIHLSKLMKSVFPHLTIVWGGSFPTIHTETVLSSSFVDVVILGQGEFIFPKFLESVARGMPPDSVPGVAVRSDGGIRYAPAAPWVDPNETPRLPYHRVDVARYLQRTYLGERTSAYHSSLGCPFRCGFCSVVAEFDGRWFSQSPQRVAEEIVYLKENFGVDSIEFFDNNFFTSERRTAEFCDRIRPHGMRWWGEGRSDTINAYSDATLRAMRDAGCTMIFTGAETSSEKGLTLMNKGGTQTGELILDFARRIREFGIIPEFSFIFGSPSSNIDADIDRDIRFIKQIKDVNPSSEIIFYVYAPVYLPGAAIFEEARKYGFDYPQSLEEWVQPKWLHFDLRKRPMTPWIKPRHVARIRNFERTLNAQFPSSTDLHLTPRKKSFLRRLSGWRYRSDFYFAPVEIRFFLTKVFRYRQPEIEGAPQYETIARTHEY